MEIRPTPYDEAMFAALIAEAVAGGDTFMTRLRDNWLNGTNRFDAPGEVYLGVWRDGALIAAGGVNRDPYGAGPEVGRVRHLYVRASARGKGVGGALTAALTDHAHAHFAVLRLRAWRPEAIRMYERAGFARTDGCNETHRLRF